MTASPISHTAQEKKERIETAVMLTKNGRPCSLQERMVDYTIPGVSIAVINDYHLEWACGYGVRKRGEPGRIDTETVFQACSISRVGDHLFFQVPGQPPLKLVRQRDGVYFLATMDDTITFVRSGQGNVLVLLLRQGPVETLALKRGPVG